MENSKDTNSLGERIRQLRKERGLSQEALAAALEVSRQAVTKWEDGSSLPSTANLFALSGFFGVPLSELTGTPEEAVISTAAADAQRSARTRTLRRGAWCLLIPCAPVLLMTSIGTINAAPPVPEGEAIIGYADGPTAIYVSGEPIPTLLFLAALGGFVAALGVLLGTWWGERRRKRKTREKSGSEK